MIVCRNRLFAAATALASVGVLAAASSAGARSAGMPLPIAGPSHATVGARYTLSGRTGTIGGRHILGTVVLRGRWDGGGWLTLARQRTDAQGRYRLAIVLRRRGTLALRLLIPGGAVATATIRVR